MTPETEAIDSALMVARQVLETLRPAIEAAGVHIQPPEFTKSAETADEYDLELALYLERDGDIVDVLEVHIVRAGKLAVSMADLEEWLRRQLQDSLSRLLG